MASTVWALYRTIPRTPESAGYCYSAHMENMFSNLNVQGNNSYLQSSKRWEPRCSDPLLKKLTTETWEMTSLVRKELELV